MQLCSTTLDSNTCAHYCCEPQNAEATAGELQHAIAALLKTHERRLQAHAALLRQIDTLQEEERETEEEIAKLQQEVTEFERTNTPRPQWSDLLDGIPVVANPDV